jgi:ATP-binding cassette subfamily B protein
MLDQEVSKPRSVGATLRRLARYFRPYWLVLLLVLALMIFTAWAQVISPQLTGQAVDCFLTPAVVAERTGQATAAEPTSTAGAASAANCWFSNLPPDAPVSDLLRGLGVLSLLLAGIYVLNSAATGLMFYYMAWAGQRVLRQLQVEVFAHLQRLSLGYYAKHESGDLMSRITNDTSTIQQAIGFALVQVLSSAIIIFWIAWVMLRANFVYGLISLAVLPAMVVATLWFSSQARRAFRRTRTEIGNVNAELEQNISGVREVQAFAREEANIESFRASNAANRDANVRAVSFSAALAPTLEALGYVALAIVAGVGGIALLRGMTIGGAAVSIGLIIAFISYVQRFNQPIAQISILWTNIQSAVAGAERIFDLLDISPEITDAPGARAMPPIAGRVQLQDVWAEYNAGEPVLRSINLDAEPGQTIAIVGPTGAGKTTIVNLLPRFYDVSKGRVLIDGTDVRDVTLESLRGQIGVVLQDTYLFSDTVLNNIRYGRPDATEEEVIAAAKHARAHDFIERLEHGYQTVLGERGAGLSQGQRQLLAIARAALTDPRILILDEATSSVDTRTERRIQAALDELLRGRTSFVIAHRLSTIRNADQVVVLVKGEIVEQGTHDELLARRGFYYDLYMSQFRRQEEMAAPRSGDGLQPALAPA